ncbi:hypothetical protein GCM10023107_80000 [Actinoplanes octamycinicus]|nr:hypothetical protein Aoc01nite_84290 [Actinoplanes octamycinicus]
MATGANVDWRTGAAAVAAAVEVPVALVVAGAVVTEDDPVRPRVAGIVELSEVDRLTLEQARDLVLAVRRAYGAVLLAAPAGLLVPLGSGDWTFADLGAAVGASAVVVTGPGPDAVNHTTLALGALAGHGLSASVITIGSDVDEAALPVTPVGRIPADPPADFAGAAEWFHPALTTPEPADPPVLAKAPAVSGRKFVLGLLGIFVFLVLLVCGVAWLGSSPGDVRVSLEAQPPPARSAVAAPLRITPPPPPADGCPPDPGPPVITHPDRATTARVDRAWQRIETWLDRHAPASAQGLRPGAPAERIDDAQRRMSVPFPADLVASLRRHDGARGIGRFDLPPSFSPSPIAQILSDWQVNCRVLGHPGITRDEWWHPDYVPFAADGGGGLLFADQRPGGHGRVGDTDPETGADFDHWPGSVAELLERTAGSLETGTPFAGRYRPRVTDGVVIWEFVR